MRILIVEDEIKIREGMGKLIKNHTDHQIIGEAQNGMEGLELAQRFKPDLIITDIRMPVMDGLEMIRRLHEMGALPHTMILSGYSEFEYARKAIQYGVEDYLLKPLSTEEIQKSLRRMEAMIREEQRKKQGIPERWFRDILSGSVEENESSFQQFLAVCGFHSRMKYLMLRGYIGAAPVVYKQYFEEHIRRLKDRYQEAVVLVSYQDITREYICLIAHEGEMEDVCDHFCRKMIWPFRGKEEQAVWSGRIFLDVADIKKMDRELKQLQIQGLTLGCEDLITDEKAGKQTYESYVFPSDISNRLKNGICREDREAIEKEGDDFLHYMHSHDFQEASVRQAYNKVYYLMMDTLQEIDSPRCSLLQKADIPKLMGEAITRKELDTAFGDCIRVITTTRVKREDISNYTIKRAINYIREHYQEGITLEEVSRRLEITPEYLSTLFNREMEVNFSTFLRRFRISHAKRLLKGSDLKIYEIAAQTGYSDGKYFARVFKEEVGVSPGDYRQMN